MIVFSLDCTWRLEPNTIANLQAALTTYKNETFACIAFTGGIFNHDKGQVRPVAQLMAEWWVLNYRHSASMVIERSSKTTRQNITEVINRLKCQGYDVADCDVYVVSERWHLMGIAYLFRRLYGIRVKQIPSNFCESLAGIRGRIVRLLLYRIDPHGTGWLSRRKIRRRGG